MNDVKPDWRIIKVDQTSYCAPEWRVEQRIETCGVFYLVDVNLHVHICSFTPNLEAWPMHAYVTFTVPWDEVDDGTATDIEFELMASEEVCQYFGTDVERLPSRPATDYVDIPEQEEDETDSAWRYRVAEHVRECLCGNPVWF